MKSIFLNRNNSDELRAFARNLAEKSNKQWDCLPFEEIVYWLHKAMIYLDGNNNAATKK